MCKIVVVGPGAVGKTACIHSFVDREIPKNYLITIGADFKVKTFETGNIVYRLQLWDLAGQERYGAVRAMYYLGLHALVLMVDLTRPESFDKAVEYLIDEIAPSVKNQPLKCAVVVGNKVDLSASIKVTDDQLAELANQVRTMLKIPVFYRKTSAFDMASVDEVFEQLVQCIAKSGA